MKLINLWTWITGESEETSESVDESGWVYSEDDGTRECKCVWVETDNGGETVRVWLKEDWRCGPDSASVGESVWGESEDSWAKCEFLYEHMHNGAKIFGKNKGKRMSLVTY